MASSPYAAVATAIISIFNTEFAAEGYTMIADNVHPALGQDRVEVGVAPVEDLVSPRNNLVQETTVEIRFLDLWVKEITPTTQVDPTRIAGYAERLRAALRSAMATDPHTSKVWYFDVQRTWYPEDPTGNKTRFYMTVRAYGNNAGLVESLG